MNVVIFGSTGMIGQGVLRECLQDPAINNVVTVGRSSNGLNQPKLRDLVCPDLFNLKPVEAELQGFDACFYCLGVTSSGMREADYERLTYTLTMSIAGTLAPLNPQMTFIFVSGAGSDSTEQGSVMWARVKGKAENALMRLPFKDVYAFRIAVVLPAHGERSRTAAYRFLYSALKPLNPLIRWAFPGQVMTTEDVGRAMIQVARNGAPKKVLESPDIKAHIPS